jgi:hypothetical protein
MVTAVVRDKTRHGIYISNDSKENSGLTSRDRENTKNVFVARNFSSRYSSGTNTLCHGSFYMLCSSQYMYSAAIISLSTLSLQFVQIVNL